MKIQDKDDQNFHEQVKYLHNPEAEFGNTVIDPLQMAAAAVWMAVKRGEPLEKALKVNGLTEDRYLKIIADMPIGTKL